MDLSNFKVLKEDNKSYEIGHPNGKSIKVEKKGLSEKSHKMIKKMCKGGMYAEGGEVGPPADFENIQQAMQAAPPQVPIQQVAPVMPAQAPVIPEAIAQSPVPNVDNPQAMIGQKGSGVEAALLTQKEAGQKEAAALANQQTQEAAAIKANQDQLAAMPTQQDILNSYKAKDDALMKAFSEQKIDPDRFWKNKSTGAKIGAGLALVLGGIGSGLTHSPNMAAELIKDQIDKDIDAQRSDQTKSMNAWKMNREALGNDLSANLATQNQMYTALKYKLMQTASQNASPVILARAQATGALIDQQIAQNRYQLGLMSQGMGTGPAGQGQYSGEDPSILVPELMKNASPGEREKAFSEIEAAQNTRKNSGSIMAAYDAAVKDQKVFSKNSLPGVNSPYLDALKAELGPTFKDVEGTVRQAAMDNLYKAIMPEVGNNEDKDAVHRDALINYLKSKSSAPVAKGHHIDLSKFRSTAPPEFSANPVVQQFMRDNPSIPNEYEAIKVLRANGRM